MPYPFQLSTTSSISYSVFLDCSTHPSLILAASTFRSVLRNVLKKQKRLPIQSQAAHLTVVLSAINDYLPYLFALDSGLSGKSVSNEEVHVILKKEVEVEWRPCLAAAIPGRELSRAKGKGLDYEIFFVLSTLAFTYSLLARVQLHSLYAAATPLPEQRTGAITSATKYFLSANSIHDLLAARAVDNISPTMAIEVSSTAHSALAALALAEATLLAVLKDDPYPALVAQARNGDDKEWMFKAPDIPKVRTHLFARLCLAAAEHAGRAHALLGGSTGGKGNGVSSLILEFTRDLRRTSRAKACRFFGIDAESSGKTGEAIAWLEAGSKELGFKSSTEEGSSKVSKAFMKMKKDLTERKEDERIRKGGEWGSDAGRFEEARVIRMLENRWNKINDTASADTSVADARLSSLMILQINTQVVPPSDPLIAGMPSGREIHAPKQYIPPDLDEVLLIRLRAPPDGDDRVLSTDSDNSEDEAKESKANPPGAFHRSSVAGEGSYY